jgi:vancomycin resistance protein YoaR
VLTKIQRLRAVPTARLACLARRGHSKRARRQRPARRLLWQRTIVAVAAIALIVGLLGLAFAGSPTRVPAGVEIADVSVGGMTPAQARKKLEKRSRAVAGRPVVFHAGGRSWKLTARQLEIRVNWRGAVSAALRQGEGPAPVRGFRRLGVRLFGADVTPAAQAYDAALQFELDRIASDTNRRHRDASLRLVSRRPVITPARTGTKLDRDAAARAIVQALASLQRPLEVDLPVKLDPPTVTATDLEPVVAQAHTALSAPVHLIVDKARFELRPNRLARLLEPPSDGRSELQIGHLESDAFFVHLTKSFVQPPRDAHFEPVAGGIRLRPGRFGRTINVPATEKAILRAALSPTRRSARLVVEKTRPKLTTAEAKKFGIKEIVGTYTTIYGGIANRIHNVQLVAHLIDNHFIRPGEEFSFNGTTGVRDASKGFLEAPVIINGELQTGLGGGVCQVSTTVFNAAYEAGLKITARTNHALYISHYPLGRDATVNYPDTDLRFVNDTAHWLLLRTFVGSSSLMVTLYGTSPHRKVVSETAPLTVAGPIPVRTTTDPTLFVGATAVDEAGSPALATSVERKVYGRSGKLLYDDHWSSHYRGEYRIVRVGSKKKPKKKPPTTTGTTTNAGTTTAATTTAATTTTTTQP